MENSTEVPQLQRALPCVWPSNPTSGSASKKDDSGISKDTALLCSLLHHSQEPRKETTETPIGGVMDRETAARIYPVKWHSVTRKGILPFVTVWMDLGGTVISERDQRKTNTVYHTYMASKKVNSQKQQNGGCQQLQGERIWGDAGQRLQASSLRWVSSGDVTYGGLKIQVTMLSLTVSY